MHGRSQRIPDTSASIFEIQSQEALYGPTYAKIREAFWL